MFRTINSIANAIQALAQTTETQVVINSRSLESLAKAGNLKSNAFLFSTAKSILEETRADWSQLSADEKNNAIAQLVASTEL